MSHPEPDREIYPNAPLKLVAFDLRFPALVDFDQAQAAFARTIKSTFPIPGPPPQTMTVDIGRGGPAIDHRAAGIRRLDRRKRQSVVLTPEALLVETSAYRRFEEYMEIVEETLAALESSADVVTALRVGLRYIDEIDPQNLPQQFSWADYIEPALLGVVDHFGNVPRELVVASVFRLTDQQQVILRYGIVQQPVVDPSGPLVIDDPVAGEHFLIDIDSSREPPQDDLPEFNATAVLDELVRLHQPVREYFERTITEKLRVDLLRKEPK